MHARRKVSPSLKWQLAAHQGFKCNMCERMLGAEVDVDHVTPLHMGGSNDPRNLQVLCLNCHRAKTAMECRSRGRAEMYCQFCDVWFSRYFIHQHTHRVRGER